MPDKHKEKLAEKIWLGSDEDAHAPEMNMAVVSRIWDEVWNQGAVEACDEIFSEDFFGHLPIMEVHGPEEFKNLVRIYRNAFPDVHFNLDFQVAEEDKVVSRYTWSGTHQGEFYGIPATGKQVSWTATATFRISDGKIREAWLNTDRWGLMEQFGVVAVT